MQYISQHFLEIVALSLPLIHLLGVINALYAVMTVRTSQGAIAWAISLITFPYLAVPLYWIFGRNKFNGYCELIRAVSLEYSDNIERFRTRMEKHAANLDQQTQKAQHVIQTLAGLPFTSGNSAGLLIDGEQTFQTIFEGIRAAKDYVLLEFYIVRDDQVGRELRDLLIEKAGQGVQVYFLYDEIGCYSLPQEYVDKLHEAGVSICGFKSTRGRANRFQLNFRNHRKIVIVDGRTAYVGGHNVGDEYLGRSARFGHWRDTHLQLEGPAVQGVQVAFIENWYWAERELPELNWEPEGAPQDSMDVISVHSGPVDNRDVNGLFFLNAINSANKRIWIASPYFVPDDPIVAALQLAALRGVDVRVLVPEKPDHLIVYMAKFWYLPVVVPYGVKIYQYQAGFLHQKVGLIDDDLAYVGTSNLDNRSFHLNFEISVVVSDKGFASATADMFEKDFAVSKKLSSADYDNCSIIFRTAVRVCRLLSPIL